MENPTPITLPPQKRSEEETLRLLRELTGREEIPEFSLQRMKELVPKDWKEGELDVDEFLASIRNGPNT